MHKKVGEAYAIIQCPECKCKNNEANLEVPLKFPLFTNNNNNDNNNSNRLYASSILTGVRPGKALSYLASLYGEPPKKDEDTRNIASKGFMCDEILECNKVNELLKHIDEKVNFIYNKSVDQAFKLNENGKILRGSSDGRHNHIANGNNKGSNAASVVLTDAANDTVLDHENIFKDDINDIIKKFNANASASEQKKLIVSVNLEFLASKKLFQRLKTVKMPIYNIKNSRIAHDEGSGSVGNYIIDNFGIESDALCCWHKRSSIIKMLNKIKGGVFNNVGIRYPYGAKELDIHSIKKLLYYYSVDGKGFHSVYEINNKIDKINNPWNKIDKEVCRETWNRYVEETENLEIHFLNKTHLNNYFIFLQNDKSTNDIPLPPKPMSQQKYETRNKKARNVSVVYKQQKKKKKTKSKSSSGKSISSASSSSNITTTTTTTNKNKRKLNAEPNNKKVSPPDYLLYPLGSTKNPREPITLKSPKGMQWFTRYCEITYRIDPFDDKHKQLHTKEMKKRNGEQIEKNAATYLVFTHILQRVVGMYGDAIVSNLTQNYTAIDETIDNLEFRKRRNMFITSHLNILDHYLQIHNHCKDPQNCKTTTSKIISNRSVKDTLYALLRIGPFSCHNYFNPLCYGDTTYACESFNGFVLQFIPKNIRTSKFNYNLFNKLAIIYWNEMSFCKSRYKNYDDNDSDDGSDDGSDNDINDDDEDMYISDNMLEEYDGLTAGGKRKGLYRRKCKIDYRLPLLKELFDAVHYG
tara:strand:- start:159 stop:2408 length:2250 start_codon:yes stop_codon:yes gene_type:complete